MNGNVTLLVFHVNTIYVTHTCYKIICLILRYKEKHLNQSINQWKLLTHVIVSWKLGNKSKIIKKVCFSMEWICVTRLKTWSLYSIWLENFYFYCSYVEKAFKIELIENDVISNLFYVSFQSCKQFIIVIILIIFRNQIHFEVMSIK